MCLRGTEDRYRAVLLLRVAVQIGVVLGTLVMETECTSYVVEAQRLGGFGKYRECVACHVVLYLRAKHRLQSPYAGIVVGGVELYVAGISFVEVELSFGGVVQSVLAGKLYQVGRRHIVLRIIGVVLSETTLIACYEVLVFGHTASQPAMSASGLEIPYLAIVHEADPESFGCSVAFDKFSQTPHPFACRAYVRQHDIEYRVFGNAVLDKRVSLQSLLVAEDTLSGTHTYARRVEARTAPVPRQMIRS